MPAEYLHLLVLSGCFLAIVMGVCAKSWNYWSRGNVTPLMVFVICFGSYSLAMPVSRLVFASPMVGSELSFMAYQLLGLIGFIMGYALSGSPAELQQCPRGRSVSVVSRVIVGSAALFSGFCYLAGIYLEAGSVWAYITQPYGYRLRPRTDGTLEFLGFTMLSATLVLGYNVSGMGGTRRLYPFFALLVVIAETLAGHRNNALWLGAPIVVLYVMRASCSRRFRLNIVATGLALALVYFVAQFVAIVRNVGVAKAYQLELLSALRWAIDPLNGELGTSFNVFHLLNTTGYLKETGLLMGKTLLVDPLVNLVPAIFWPARPMTIAQEFSRWYYGSLSYGLGFSIVAEAVINFGYLGPFVVMALIGHAVGLFYSYVKKRAASAPLSAMYALSVPAIVNLNRIDFATVVKLFTMRVLVIVLIGLLSQALLRGPRKVR